VGKTEKRELVSRLTFLLLHLLKWRFQPAERVASWEASITEDRRSPHVALLQNRVDARLPALPGRLETVDDVLVETQRD
jgi:Domain of unknown function DUF29